MHEETNFLRRYQSLSYSIHSLSFMKLECSLPCSQESTTGPYFEQNKSSPQLPTRISSLFSLFWGKRRLVRMQILSLWGASCCVVYVYYMIYIYVIRNRNSFFYVCMYQPQFCLCENHHAILTTSIITCVTFYIILVIYQFLHYFLWNSLK
jgi:hypothetical protein